MVFNLPASRTREWLAVSNIKNLKDDNKERKEF